MHNPAFKKKQYQKLEDSFWFDKIIKKEESTFKNYNKLNLIYNSKHNFYKYYQDRKTFYNLSFKSKYSFLHKLLKDLNKFKQLKTLKRETEKKKKQICMIQLQNYIINCQKHIMMNTIIYHMQKEKNES